MRAEYRIGGTGLGRRLFGTYHRLRRLACRIQTRLNGSGSAPGLQAFEEKVFSQNGEDGIIREVFRRVGVRSRYFVEFGIGDGTECCTRNLLENEGWRGLWIEGSPPGVERARREQSERPVVVDEQFITRENIVDTFRRHEVPNQLDLLVVDVDGNDYWILEELLQNFHPTVVVIEYNASMGSHAHWVLPYDPAHVWDGTLFFGASLAALHGLARANGYELVGCDSLGVNAFFVDRQRAEGHFPLGRGPADHYRPPRYGLPTDFGHPLTRS